MSEGPTLTLNKYRSSTRFEGIILPLCHIYILYAEYYDGFFHMRQMEEACNINMAEEFNPS